MLRGANVGGNRVFRPATLPAALPKLDLVNIGAAGTFVVRAPIARTALKAALRSQLPFTSDIVICEGSEILSLLKDDPFASLGLAKETVRFISVLGSVQKSEPKLPAEFGDGGEWMVKVFHRRGCFLVGAYQRHEKTVRHLGKIDKLVDGPITTRNWNTIVTIGRVLGKSAGKGK